MPQRVLMEQARRWRFLRLEVNRASLTQASQHCLV